MPWRELSAMDQREEFVKLSLAVGANKSALCRRFGISRSNGYKWLDRYGSWGPAGLAERSRRPHHSPGRSSAAIEAAVVEIRLQSNNAWGGRKIAAVLERRGWPDVPAPSTITDILRRHGLLGGQAGAPGGRWQRFEHAAPNDLWQMDFKGHFALHHGRCHALTVLDDHSRYALGIGACADETEVTARDRLVAIFRRFGLPWAMVMDNGPPWGGDQPYTALTVWLLRLGIRVTHGRPHHPQTQGKDERFHRTLKAEVLLGRSFADLDRCQAAFDAWRHVYNHERPHQAIDMAVPADRYRPSPRCFPDVLAPIEYAAHDVVRKVDRDGFISFNNRPWRISKAFRGQPVALRPTLQDGVFSVHFCAHKIATIDLRTTACGYVDNASALPTSPQAQQQQKIEQ